jgi:hypothetical protein
MLYTVYIFSYNANVPTYVNVECENNDEAKAYLSDFDILSVTGTETTWKAEIGYHIDNGGWLRISERVSWEEKSQDDESDVTVEPETPPSKNIFKHFRDWCESNIEGNVIASMILVISLFLVLAFGVVIILFGIYQVTTPSSETYEISAFYRVSEDDFCVYIPNEDGGMDVVNFSADNTVIYLARDDHDEVEVEIVAGFWQNVKVYTSKTPDEIERVKPNIEQVE